MYTYVSVVVLRSESIEERGLEFAAKNVDAHGITASSGHKVDCLTSRSLLPSATTSMPPLLYKVKPRSIQSDAQLYCIATTCCRAVAVLGPSLVNGASASASRNLPSLVSMF